MNKELKPHEVRIGNWIHVSHTSGPLGYSQLDIHDLIEMQDQLTKNVIRGHSPLSPKFKFKPIPLTEEMFIKSGFDLINIKHADGSVSEGVLKKYPLLIQKNKLDNDFIVCRFSVSDVNKFDFLTHIEFLHQLQNIYFDIEKKELEIKL